jgi:single-stranded DNA-binding protein
MNSCVLMAKIVRSPQLRYTQDNQLAVADMMVEFYNSAPNSPPCTLKAVAWGNLATDISQQYKEGNEVIISGRLRMNVIDKQEGFKEKIAELTISHIYPVGGVGNNVVNLNAYKSVNNSYPDADSESNFEDNPRDNLGNSNSPSDIDHIPF